MFSKLKSIMSFQRGDCSNSIPSDPQASKQTLEKVFGCKSWTDLQDLDLVSLSRGHYIHPQHHTIWHLEFQLQEKKEWVKVVKWMPDTKTMYKFHYFLLEEPCTALTHIAAGDALSSRFPDKKIHINMRKIIKAIRSIRCRG